MQIKMVPIESIVPYQKNAKKHPAKQITAVARSIEEFGWAQPLVVDKNSELIIGHCRLEAAKTLGLETAPVVVMDNLSPAQIKALRLADNKLNESDWVMDLVIDELKDLNAGGFDIELTGFDRDLLLDEEDMDDVVPELPAKAKSKVGDIFQLGEHRLMCGDATDPKHVEKLMQGVKADLVFTDPPYNVDYSGSGKQTTNKIMNDKMTPEQFDTFLKAVFKRYAEITKKGAALYVFHSSSTQNQFENAINGAGLEVKQQLIWNKPTMSMGWSHYRFKHEPFFYCGFPKTKTEFYGDRTNGTVVDLHDTEKKLFEWARREKRLEAEGKTTIWTMKRAPVQDYVHPTQKPVELIVYALTNSTKHDDIVVDFFGGSGSTLIACQKAGRINYSMELDPKYVDVIIERYEKYTEKKVKRLN